MAAERLGGDTCFIYEDEPFGVVLAVAPRLPPVQDVGPALGVEPQQVVLGESESADGRL